MFHWLTRLAAWWLKTGHTSTPPAPESKCSACGTIVSETSTSGLCARCIVDQSFRAEVDEELVEIDETGRITAHDGTEIAPGRTTILRDPLGEY